MKSNSSRFISFVMMVAIFVSSAPFTFALDEGMFAPGQIVTLPLKKKGLKMRPEDIYNPAGRGLTDAVIRLSIGCTAEFVSPHGLILTHHHCGFEAVAASSTPEQDLIQ